MANVQKYFEQFHEEIRVDMDDGEPLREKREIILDKIRKHLKENGNPGFIPLLQGSYAIGTGIMPIEELEYDIDVGLRFDILDSLPLPAPAIVHKWVHDAVEGHTDDVEDKGPCIRVAYSDDPPYHVDLVCYAWKKTSDGLECYRLAHKSKGWREADPPKLMKHIEEARERFKDTVDTTTNTKTDQFRRCVRYLKRWNDVCIPREMDSKPSGLAWALLAAKHLQVSHQVDGKPDDRKALYYLARQLADTPGRIVARKPSPEYEDILQSLSNSDMDELKGRLNDLAEVLSFADNHKDPVDACKMLRGVFGNDYPVPSLEDTGKGTKAPAIITSSPSAA